MKDAYLVSSSRSASLGRSLADVLTVTRNVSPPPSLFGVPTVGDPQAPAAAAARLLRTVFPDDVCGHRVALPGEMAVTRVLGAADDEAALELSTALSAAAGGGGDLLSPTAVAVAVGRHAAVGMYRPGGGLDAGDAVVVQTLAWLCSEAASRPR